MYSIRHAHVSSLLQHFTEFTQRVAHLQLQCERLESYTRNRLHGLNSRVKWKAFNIRDLRQRFRILGGDPVRNIALVDVYLLVSYKMLLKTVTAILDNIKATMSKWQSLQLIWSAKQVVAKILISMHSIIVRIYLHV